MTFWITERRSRSTARTTTNTACSGASSMSRTVRITSRSLRRSPGACSDEASCSAWFRSCRALESEALVINKRRTAAVIVGSAIAVAIGIRVATEEPDWQAIEDYRAIKEGANILDALAVARKIVELGSHERFVDAAEFLIERGAAAYEVDNLDMVLSGINALQTLRNYGAREYGDRCVRELRRCGREPCRLQRASPSGQFLGDVVRAQAEFPTGVRAPFGCVRVVPTRLGGSQPDRPTRHRVDARRDRAARTTD